mmetsp:Transcript_13044/g.48413  ORF Transcript_13044/g.48413 Transcript_13044/m.48413 type:complete len:454 (-) Transcript_13044:341-1702(-)
MRDKLGVTAFGKHLLRALPAGERIRLCEEIGHELVVAAQLLSADVQRQLRLRKAQEVAGDDLAHVQQLEEGVLPVRARLPEVDLPHGVVDLQAVDGHRLPVGLHIDLLDVRRQLQESLCVRQSRTHGVLQEARVPHAEQAQDDRDVLVHGLLPEVPVHAPRPREELVDQIKAVLQRDRQNAHAAADAVPAADPVPEAKETRGGDPEAVHQLNGRLRGARDEVLGHHLGLSLPRHRVHGPLPQGPRVEHRLGGLERLGYHDDERLLRLQARRAPRDVDRVDVGQEAQLVVLPHVASLPLRPERLGEELRPQVRAPDADADDILKSLSRRAAQLSRSKIVCKRPDLIQDVVHFPNRVGAVGKRNALVPRRSERRVQRRAPLRRVYDVAPHHGLDFFFQVLPICKFKEEAHRVQGRPLAAVVQNDAFRLRHHEVHPVCVLHELPKVRLLDALHLIL